MQVAPGLPLVVAVGVAAITGTAALAIAAYVGYGAVTFALSASGHGLGIVPGVMLLLCLIGLAAMFALFGWAMVWAAWTGRRRRAAAAPGIAIGLVVAGVAVAFGPMRPVEMAPALFLLAVGEIGALMAWWRTVTRSLPAS